MTNFYLHYLLLEKRNFKSFVDARHYLLARVNTAVVFGIPCPGLSEVGTGNKGWAFK